MKRIVIILLALTCAVSASAQFVQGPLQRKGTQLVSGAGEHLTDTERAAVLSDIDGSDLNDVWSTAVNRRKIGTGLTIGGSVLTVGGGALMVIGVAASLGGAVIGGVVGSIGGQETASQAASQGASAGAPYITAGLVTGLAGLAGLGVGVPLLISNNRKLNHIVDQYNGTHPQLSLAVGLTDSGIGLQFRF